MKPLIGITASLDHTQIRVQRENSDAVLQAGGLPVIVPYIEDEQAIRQLASRLDGLLLTGGGDIDPFLFHEEPLPHLGSITPERDLLEVLLVREMLFQDKPILGICRGCQILNIAAGGDMYQDIYSQSEKPLLQHSQRAPRYHVSHFVDVQKGTLLHRITGEEKLKVNSFHHQAVRKLPEGFRVAAASTDGIIEAFDSREHAFVLGVQWHPEDLYVKHPTMLQLFHAFVTACSAK
ncbi:gamma-glutamyl-gamma-aminobutyrate hydrolase family protein [Ammoniphilus sp. CFH 90114]|uniref:gamma-glutamyl-gamma-aminobutyrate hydrolase family protein n=1 Tax=Ammoniphilus sp. CFH 90114 TaxID=2493665 RepID=UPI00100F2E9A|nr:gamma-glutamyl-gamma-aminobutyrate hydrolase family protein [Ammoniphilus sp. CFH 90114]RXT07819.1 gamma-glutamyl-gamma-aminobutyrate hydrolase family protein [Ammoniphilus sp. CFH 90114]